MSSTYDLVITSGGIGPTHDGTYPPSSSPSSPAPANPADRADITYSAISKAFGTDLAYDDETIRRMETLSKRRYNLGEQTEEQKTARLRMALFPVGAEVLFVREELSVALLLGAEGELIREQVGTGRASGGQGLHPPGRAVRTSSLRPIELQLLIPHTAVPAAPDGVGIALHPSTAEFGEAFPSPCAYRVRSFLDFRREGADARGLQDARELDRAVLDKVAGEGQGGEHCAFAFAGIGRSELI